MIKREPKSVLQLHRIQEAQREKICCEIPSRNAIHDRLCGTVCGFRRRSKETPPARSQASPGPFLRGVWRAEIPCTKSAESDGFHNPFQRSDSPGKPRTTQRSEMKQEKALTLYAPGRSLPPAVRAVLPGFRVALFSPAPQADDAFLVGNHDFPHWEGVSPDASRLFRSRK